MSSHHETDNIKNIKMFLKCTIYCFRMRMQIIVSSFTPDQAQYPARTLTVAQFLLKLKH